MGRLASVILILLLAAAMVSCQKQKEDLGPFRQPDKQVFSYDEQLPLPPEPANDALVDSSTQPVPGDDTVVAGQLPPPPPASPPAVVNPTPQVMPATATDEHVLRIDFTGECWVKVSGPNDDIFAGLMKAGDSKSWGPEKYFMVTIGKPDAANIFFDRQPLYGGDKPAIKKLYFVLPPEAESKIPPPEAKPVTPAVPATPAPAPVKTPTPSAPAKPASPDGYTLRIDITDECWVKVTDGDEVVYQGLMQKGDSKTLGPRKNYDIVLGKPKNASVYLDNRKVYGEGAGYPTTLAFTLPGSIDVSKIAPSPAPAAAPTAPPAQPSPAPAPATPAPEEKPAATEKPAAGDMASYYGWIETGQWALAQKNYDDAIDSFEEAYAIEPNYAQVNTLLGKAYHGKGSYVTAIDYLNKALNLNPSDADSLLEMARTYEDKGDKTKAIEYYEKYLKDNDREDVRKHVDELKGG